MLTWIESHGGFTSVHKGLMTSRAWHLTRNGQLNQFPIHMPNFPPISWSIFEWQRILLWVAIIRDSDHHFQKGKQWGRRMQSKQHGKKRLETNYYSWSLRKSMDSATSCSSRDQKAWLFPAVKVKMSYLLFRQQQQRFLLFSLIKQCHVLIELRSSRISFKNTVGQENGDAFSGPWREWKWTAGAVIH